MAALSAVGEAEARQGSELLLLLAFAMARKPWKNDQPGTSPACLQALIQGARVGNLSVSGSAAAAEPNAAVFMHG
jgi:hypothetical protein